MMEKRLESVNRPGFAILFGWPPTRR